MRMPGKTPPLHCGVTVIRQWRMPVFTLVPGTAFPLESPSGGSSLLHGLRAFHSIRPVHLIRFVHAACMQVGLRHFDSRTLDWFAGALRSADATRHRLVHELCERTGWHNALGRPCLSATAKALPALADRSELELPPPQGVPDPAEDVPDTRLACLLEDLGPVSLEPVGDADDRRIWEAMMATHHPLGWARPPGGQKRYWIRSHRHGTLGGTGFGLATWKLRARDEWIKWSAVARAANIGRVICGHRFLLLPGVRVYGLASRVLRMAAERIADDWEARYARRAPGRPTHT